MINNTHDPVRLTNARIVDVENGCYFPPEVSLVIQDGKIAAMPGLPGEHDLAAGGAVIDLLGKTLIPGLFNTHCHLQFLPQNEVHERQIAKNLQDCVDRGITNVRDTLCYDLQLNRSWMEKITRGDVLGPRIHQAVHVSPVGGTYAPKSTLKTRFTFSLIGLKLVDYGTTDSGVVSFRPGANEGEVRAAVDRAIDERGAAAIKLCDQPEHFMTYKPGAQVMTFEQLAAAADQARKRGIPTTMHNVTAAGFRHGVKAGLNSMAHLPLDGELTESDVDLLLESPTCIEPTLSVGYFMSYSVKGSPFSGHSELLRLDRFRAQTYDEVVEETWLPELQASKKQMNTALAKGEVKVFGVIDITEPFRYYAKMIPTGGQTLRLLVKHGAASRLGCGNDAGPANTSAAAVGLELAMFDFVLNRSGTPVFSAADMLRTATIQSARSMGVEERFGSIQTGKVADLAVLDGDPLQDFRLVGKPVQALFMNGDLVINRCSLEIKPQS
jgi:imidazolonepropionase-like amidohydrolase